MSVITDERKLGEFILDLPKCDKIKEVQDFLGDPESELFLGELHTVQSWSHQGQPWSKITTTVNMKGDTIYNITMMTSLQGHHQITEYTFPFKLDDDDKCFIINAIKCFFNTDADSLVREYSGLVSLFTRINAFRDISEEELFKLYETKGAVGGVNTHDNNKHMSFPHTLEIGTYLTLITSFLMNRKQLQQSISLEEHKGIVRELEEQNKQLKKEYVRFQKERNAAEGTVKKMDSKFTRDLRKTYRKEYTKLVKEHSALKNMAGTKLDKVQNEHEEMKDVISDLKNENIRLKNIVREQLDDVKSAHAEMKDEISHLYKENAKLQKELTKTEQVCDEIIDEESQKCKDEIEKLKRQLRRPRPSRRISRVPPPPPGSPPNRRTRNRIETVN
jgi:hypothetical protein